MAGCDIGLEEARRFAFLLTFRQIKDFTRYFEDFPMVGTGLYSIYFLCN